VTKKMLTENDLNDRLQLSKKLALSLKPLLLEGYRINPGADTTRQLDTENKSSFRDIVTRYDKVVEEVIIQNLENLFPGETIVGEESCAHSGLHPRELCKNSERAWILDPIDGTTNYSRSYPFFCTTLSLIERDGDTWQPTIGVTFNPVNDELFYAARNLGAWVNGHELKVSSVENPQNALLTTGFASLRSNPNNPHFLNVFSHLTTDTLGVRRDGSAALDLAYVAAGRIDAYWESGLSIWDTSAGILMIEEAGGTVTHHDENERDIFSGEVLSSNTRLHKWLLNKIKEHQ
jgi:myo-inositol-1(or 4)-monophosphatase